MLNLIVRHQGKTKNIVKNLIYVFVWKNVLLEIGVCTLKKNDLTANPQNVSRKCQKMHT